jgi:hypothetical protein
MPALEELMKCPIDWKAKLQSEDWFLRLPHLDWYYSFAQHAVDGEDLPLYPDEFEEIYEDPEELRSQLINLRDRRPKAESLYMKRAGRLGDLSFMTPSQHGKHFRAGRSEASTLAESKKGISLFFKDYGSVRLEETFWSWFLLIFDNVHDYYEYEEFLDPNEDLYKTPQSALWRRFLSDSNLRICTDTIRPVGACNGEPTSFLCYDLHIDARKVHCYPISGPEASRVMRGLDIPGNDALNC